MTNIFLYSSNIGFSIIHIVSQKFILKVIIAQKYKIPVFAICGILGKDYQKVYKEGIKKIYPLCENEKELEFAINNAGKLIAENAYQIIKDNFI